MANVNNSDVKKHEKIKFKIKYRGVKHDGLICPKCNKVFGNSAFGWKEKPKCKHSKQAYLNKIKKINKSLMLKIL
jgi:hypothetical protein